MLDNCILNLSINNNFKSFYVNIKMFDHKMHLNQRPFDNIKSLKKDIEIRVNDPKRQGVKNGDVIRFYLRPDDKEFFDAIVVGIHKIDDLLGFYKSMGLNRFGCDETWTAEKLVNWVLDFYGSEKIHKYGIIGIELELIK